MNGEGGAGPSLIDNTYIYGPHKTIITEMIKNGTGERGMPAWKEMLSAKDINVLADYIISLRKESKKNK